MRLFILADIHGSTGIVEKMVEAITEEKSNTILICGDITNFGPMNLAKLIINKIAETRLPIFFVPGNCDPRIMLQGIENATCLHGIAETVNNTVFIGLGGSNITPFATLIEWEEREISKLLNEAYKKIKKAEGHIVLVSHVPPYNTKLDLARTNFHVGSTAVRDFIEIFHPHLVVCAHIHEARGIDRISDIILVNPGPAMAGFYATAIIGEKIEVHLKSLY